MNRPMTVEDLLDELRRRVQRLEHDSARVRSVGRLRELVQRAFNAGEMAGASAQLDSMAQRLSQVLDDATDRATDPDPGASDSHTRLEAARNDRRALWQAIDAMRLQCKADAERLRTDAHRRHMNVAQRTDEALQPERPLRVRVGRWLYALGVSVSERGVQS